MTYSFPPYRFDTQGLLWHESAEVRLTAKAAAILKRLLDDAGTWVSKAAIMSAVWPDAHVQADNIKVLVREIRHALGDSPRDPRFIRSARSRGYAFIAPVTGEDHAEPAPSLDRGPAFFVNRGAELAALADALDASKASLRRFVLLCGERGAGKSAICESFLRAVQASEPVRVAVGRASDLESETPYYPFFDALIGLDREEPRLRSILREHAPSWLASVPPWMGNCMSAGLGLPRYEELEQALSVVAGNQTLILVIEDLQWADIASINALRRLAANGLPSRLLIVATCCCERGWSAGARAKNQLVGALSAQTGAKILPVGPLSVEHIYRYLAGRFGAGCPVELAGAVHETTKGNAFMLASLVDCLVASASIVTDASGWRLKAGMPMTALSLTDVLREAIARRLESLDPAEREVLEAGALIGYEFKASSVANATANKIASARTLLDLVSRRGDFILTVSDDECRVSDPMYRFRHPSYPGVIADRAPWLRQIRVSAYIDQQPPTAMPRRNYRLLKRA